MSGGSQPTDPDIARGIELFAEGRYHAAHGAFERAWVRRGRAALAVQGLVQIAAACVHLDRGRLRPAERLLRRGRAKLLEDPSASDHVRPGDVVASLDGCLEVLAGRPEDRLDGPAPRTAFPVLARAEV